MRPLTSVRKAFKSQLGACLDLALDCINLLGWKSDIARSTLPGQPDLPPTEAITAVIHLFFCFAAEAYDFTQ